MQLLKASDAADKADREHYQQVKKLEGQITELACWKHQTSGRFQTLEQENAGLRARVEEILRLGEKYPRREATCQGPWPYGTMWPAGWRVAVVSFLPQHAHSDLTKVLDCSGFQAH